MPFIRLVRAGAVALALLAPGVAEADAASDLCVPQEAKATPARVCGKLANGMRYVVQNNATLLGTTSVILLIKAGSMQEAGDQHGVAHILEHMAFHGSTHVSDGETLRMLQRLGLRLGADVNAMTGPADTIFRFDMTKGGAASIDTALMLTREIAGELTLSQTALDTERNIVLAEARGRNAGRAAASRAVLANTIGDHPFARLTIGTPDEIKSASLQRVRDFYDTFYRPERAVLIVAGDVNPAFIEAKIQKQFGDWRGKGADGRNPGPAVAPKPSTQVAVVPGIDNTYLRVQWSQKYRAFPTDHAERLRRWIEKIGDMALMQRVRDENAKAGLPMEFFGGIDRDDIPGVARGVALQANGVRDLGATAQLMLNARAQFMRYGLTQTEIDRNAALERSNLLAYANVTLATSAVAGAILQSAAGDEPYETLPQNIADFEEAMKGLTAERTNAVLRTSLAGEGPSILYLTPKPLPGGEQTLKDAIAAAAKATITAYTAPVAKPWTHTDFGVAGTVAERRTDSALDVTYVRFANNVRLTVKPTTYAAGQIHVAVRFGHGQLDLPKDRLAPSDFAATVLNDGGLADMTKSELTLSLMGRHVIGFASMAENAFVLDTNFGGTIPTQAKDIDLAMQVLAAKVSTPGWVIDGWDNDLRRADLSYESDLADPGELFGTALREALHPGDLRWTETAPQNRVGWKVDDAVAFIKPILATAPLEVIVVGDITPDQAIAAVAKTFGALPARPDIPEPARLRTVSLPGPTTAPIVIRHNGPRDQAVVGIAWPATDAFVDHRTTQAARVLGDIMQTRAFDELRVKQGETYTPQASANFSVDLPGFGFITMSAAVRPEDVDSAFATMDAIAADLAKTDVSADELQRARSPRIETALRARQSNGFWVADLAGAQTDTRLLTLSNNVVPDLQSLTAADIRAAAKRWLVKAKSLRLEVIPE